MVGVVNVRTRPLVSCSIVSLLMFSALQATFSLRKPDQRGGYDYLHRVDCTAISGGPRRGQELKSHVLCAFTLTFSIHSVPTFWTVRDSDDSKWTLTLAYE